MRYLSILVLLIVCLSTFSCTQYSTGLQKSSTRSEETSAVATLRTIAQAQTTYSISNSGYGTFEQLVAGGYLDGRFNKTKPEMHGFVFTMSVTPGNPGSFACNADPAPTANLGGQHFYIDATSQEIRVNATRPASAGDEIFKP